MKVSLSENYRMNILFILWIVTEYTLLHTLFSQIALILFFGIVFIDFFLKKRMPYTIVFLLYLCFYFVCCLNIWLGFSINADESRRLLSTIGINFVFLIVCFYYLKKIQFKELFSVLALSALIVSIFSWSINFFRTGSVIFRETGGVNGNGMAILNAFVICLIIISGALTQLRYRMLVAFLALLCILSGTRKAFIIIFLVLLVYYCFKSPNRIPKYVLIISISLIITYLILTKISLFYNSIGNRLEAFLFFIKNEEGDGSIVSRSNYIDLGMSFFSKSPIWGNGINCFRIIQGSYGTYSHNNYVELLFSVGLVGTISFYSIYLYIIVKAVKEYLKNKSDGSVIGISIIVACLATDYAQVVYYDRGSLLFLIIALSLIGKSNTSIKNLFKKQRNKPKEI